MKRLSRIVPIFLTLILAGEVKGQAPGWFKPVTSNLGIQIPTGSEALACPVDINEDDYPDLVSLFIPTGGTVFTERKPFKIRLNVQDPESSNPKARKYIDVTPQSHVNEMPNDTGYHANCYTMADFNNDGHIDLATGNFYYNKATYAYPNDRCQVFMGDGTGKFTYKQNNGLSSMPLLNVRMLTALDYNRDGNIDIYISTFYSDLNAGVRDHGYLMKGNGDGTFTDVTNASGIGALPEAMYGSSSTDYNNDCLPDIFTAPYCRSAGMVLKNNGDGTFTDMATTLGYNLERTGAGQRSCTFSIIPEDVNNDGNMDLFFSVVHGGNAAGQFRSTIGYNKGPAANYAFDIQENVLPVKAPATASRGDYDGGFLDFDNDGLKDLVMMQGTYAPATDRTYFWRQKEDHTFEEVTAALGLLTPDLKSSSSIEVADYDMDGDDDLFIAASATGGLEVLENTVGQDKNHVAVKLIPQTNSGVNRSGIGARIYVYYGGKMQMREITVGRGMHTGQQPFILNFGLGDATKIDSIMVKWPNSSCMQKMVYNPPINTIVAINSFPTDVSEIKNHAPEIKVFPNPTERYMVIQSAELVNKTVQAVLYDAAGRTTNLSYNTSDGDKLIFDMAILPPGVYFVRVEMKDAQIFTQKIIKN